MDPNYFVCHDWVNISIYWLSFQRRKRSALPPSNIDVELLALESNVVEGKESREGRQLQRFGALKKKGKRRRVVVKRKRQKLGRSAPVSRTIVPTTPPPTIDSKVAVLQKFNDSETMKQVDYFSHFSNAAKVLDYSKFYQNIAICFWSYISISSKHKYRGNNQDILEKH